jgi:hypothetical protein
MVCGKSLFLRARCQEGELEGGKNSLESGKVIGYGLGHATPRYAIASTAGNRFLMVSRLIPCTLFTFSTPTPNDG